MIKNISINNFGSLINFSNNQCVFQSGKTVIHGMNGSGKSQICTILRQIEKVKKSKTLPSEKTKDELKNISKFIITRISKEASSAIISININDYSFTVDSKSNKISENGSVPDFYVFNDDYVNDNIGDFLDIHDREIRIGQKNVERDRLITEKNEKDKALEAINKEIDIIIKEAKNDSGYAGQVRTDKIICRNNYLSNLNPGESFPDAKNDLAALANPPEPILDYQKFSLPSLLLEGTIKDSINNIMTNAFMEPKLTHEFYKLYLSVKKSFYEDGIILFNKEKNICPFCLTSKTENDLIIQELINYINSDYNEKLNIIQNIIDILNKNKKELQIFINNWNGYIPIVRDKSKILSITEKIDDLVLDEEIINRCIDLLNTKLNSMDKIFELENTEIFLKYENLINIIKNQYLQHIESIKNVNNKIDKISGLKQSIGDKIIKNQMFLLWNKPRLRERYYELTKEIEDIKEKIEITSNSISNNTIPDFFNQIIKILGIVKYELNQESLLILKLENDYDISKEGYRISAGERKIIGFSYFLAEVLSTAVSNADLINKTIIIDDPVDSSDYDKFYSFISVIEKFDSILVNIFKNNEIKLGQIIIFTHSALLYERFVNSKEIDYKQVMIENNKTIITKPKKRISLTTFSSYIKKITNYIKKMECSNTKDIGNYIRRVLEIISSVENIDSNKITNLNASSKLNALVNHLSHDSIERILDPLPASSEYIEACIELVETIEVRMPNLYNTIVENYFDGNRIEYYRNEYNKKYLGLT